MGKKKKGKSQKKYAAVGDEPSNSKKKTGGKAKNHNHQQPIRRSKRAKRQVDNSSIDDYKFRQEVEDGTRTIINIEADGNCLFGSVSDQLYHDKGHMHHEVRHEICDFIEAMKEEFQHFLFVEEDDEDVADFDSYIHNMREGGEWGGNVELVAASRLYRRNIVVFSAEHAFTIEHGQADSGGPDMMLSYHGAEHYNSVRAKNAGMPPPPSRTAFAKPRTIIESGECETETVLDTPDDEKMDVDDKNGETTTIGSDKACEEEVLEPPPAKPPKKNDQCPCGSGLRYKKCCLEAVKSKERARKWKAKQQQADDVAMDDDTGDEKDERMEGGFRVLKI